jgi:hypothetical protein
VSWRKIEFMFDDRIAAALEFLGAHRAGNAALA